MGKGGGQGVLSHQPNFTSPRLFLDSTQQEYAVRGVQSRPPEIHSHN